MNPSTSNEMQTLGNSGIPPISNNATGAYSRTETGDYNLIESTQGTMEPNVDATPENAHLNSSSGTPMNTISPRVLQLVGESLTTRNIICKAIMTREFFLQCALV